MYFPIPTILSRGTCEALSRLALKAFKPNDVDNREDRAPYDTAWNGMGRLSRGWSMAATAVRAGIIDKLGVFVVDSLLTTYAVGKLYKLRKSGVLPPLAPAPPALGDAEAAGGGGDGDGDGVAGSGGGGGAVAAAVAPAAQPFGSAEGEACAMWCKGIAAHALRAGGTLATQAALVWLVWLLRFDDPKWAGRFTTVAVFGGDTLGGYLTPEVIRRLKLG
jgi:hypothetical protein